MSEEKYGERPSQAFRERMLERAIKANKDKDIECEGDPEMIVDAAAKFEDYILNGVKGDGE